MRPPRDPPVETWIINEDHCIRAMMAEIAVGLRDQTHELGQAGENARKAHDRVIAKREEMLAAGLCHAVAAEADAGEIGPITLEGKDQVGAVNITTRFADAEEDAHEDVPVEFVGRAPQARFSTSS